jgi:MFS family permease
MPRHIAADNERGREERRIGGLDYKKGESEQSALQEVGMVSQRSLAATIASTLFIRVASRISFVILSFYLGAHFASATIVVMVLETFYLSELVLAPLVGSLSDRLGRKPFLLLAPILACLASCCMLLAARLFPHPDAKLIDPKMALLLLMILLGRLLEGASSGMNVPASLGYITDATVGSARLRTQVVTAFEIVTVGGLVLAIPLGGKISSALDTWGFLVVMAIYLLTLLIIVLGVDECMEQREQRPRQRPGRSLLAGLIVIRHKRIYTFLPAWFSVNALVGAWTALITIMLSYPDPAADQRHPGQLLYGGFSRMSASLWVGLFALLFLVGMGLWMLLLPRLRRTTVMLIGLGGLALAIISLTVINKVGESPHAVPAAAVPIIAVMLLFTALGMLLLSGFTPVSLTQMGAIAETLPGQRGAVMGLYSVVLAIGQLLGATIGGFFVDLYGFYGLMIFSVLMGLLSLCSVLYIRSHAHDLIAAKSASLPFG